jgi:hypothetical protein
MHLTIRSFNFRVRSLGSVCLSDLINSGSSAGQTAITKTLETSVGSSSEVNSPVSIKPMKSKGNTIEGLNEIMENLDLEESSGYSNTVFDENLNNINNYSEEDFLTCHGNVSSNSEGTWRSGLKLHGDEKITLSLGSSQYASN